MCIDSHSLFIYAVAISVTLESNYRWTRGIYTLHIYVAHIRCTYPLHISVAHIRLQETFCLLPLSELLLKIDVEMHVHLWCCVVS